MNILRLLTDLLFPPRCVGCGTRGDWLCEQCIAASSRLPADRCAICARPLAGVTRCPRCWSAPPAFRTLESGFVFDGPIRTAIHLLKYRRARHLAAPLIRAAASALTAGDSDAIVPVPLHARRLAERGFNQSGLLALSLGEILDVPVLSDALERIRDTPPQVSLSPAQRRANVRGAFAPGPSSVRGRRVLLIDDVCTTGSTLDSAARTLRAAGAADVRAFTVARAI